MRAADLHKVWSGPDNSRLTTKQYSFRLPVHVAANLAALCDLYPNKTKTELVGDLLAAALSEVIRHLPYERGSRIGPVPDHPEWGDGFEMKGLAAEFRQRANKHHKELERELGTEKPQPLYPGDWVVFENEQD